MTEQKKQAAKLIDKVEQALEERKTDRRVLTMDLPPELERRSGRDRRNDAVS